jgi:hypothetical protein
MVLEHRGSGLPKDDSVGLMFTIAYLQSFHMSTIAWVKLCNALFAFAAYCITPNIRF